MEYEFPKIALLTYTGIGIIVLGILLLLGLVWGRKSPLNYILGSIICVITGIFLLHVDAGGTLKIEDNQLIFKVPLFKTKIITSSDIQEIKTIDIEEDSAYRPVKKKSGGSFKNLKTGWFVLANGESAFLGLEGKRGLYIKTKDNRIYLIGIQDFDTFLKVFREKVKPTEFQ